MFLFAVGPFQFLCISMASQDSTAPFALFKAQVFKQHDKEASEEVDPEIVFVTDTENDGLESGNFLQLKFFFVVPIDQYLIQIVGIPCCDVSVKIECDDVDKVF